MPIVTEPLGISCITAPATALSSHSSEADRKVVVGLWHYLHRFLLNRGWNFTSQAEYSVPLVRSWEGYGRATGIYRSGSFTTFYVYSPFYHPVGSYFIAYAAVGVRHGPWTSEFFVRNLTDKVAELNARVTTDGYQVSTIRPRMFGLTLTRSF